MHPKRSRFPLFFLVILILLGSVGLGAEGCLGGQIQEIDSSDLSEQDKASAKLFMAESAWVQAKNVLADVLTELRLAGITLSNEQNEQIKAAIAAGNRTLKQAQAMLERSDISAASMFATTLRSLQTATRNLSAQTGVLRGEAPKVEASQTALTETEDLP